MDREPLPPLRIDGVNLVHATDQRHFLNGSKGAIERDVRKIVIPKLSASRLFEAVLIHPIDERVDQGVRLNQIHTPGPEDSPQGFPILSLNEKIGV